MKILQDQEAASADAVAKCYSGPEQKVWELVMGKQIDIGGASSTLELAERAHVGPGMKGVELNCNNGGGMRCLVRLAGVDSMIGVDLTKSVVETGRQRTEEEGLGDKIKFINKNSLENGLPDTWGSNLNNIGSEYLTFPSGPLKLYYSNPPNPILIIEAPIVGSSWADARS